MTSKTTDTKTRQDVLLTAAKHLAQSLSMAPNDATAAFFRESACSIGELIEEAGRGQEEAGA